MASFKFRKEFSSLVILKFHEARKIVNHRKSFFMEFSNIILKFFFKSSKILFLFLFFTHFIRNKLYYLLNFLDFYWFYLINQLKFFNIQKK